MCWVGGDPLPVAVKSVHEVGQVGGVNFHLNGFAAWL